MHENRRQRLWAVNRMTSDDEFLRIYEGDLPQTADNLADLLAAKARLFDRGRVLVELGTDAAKVLHTRPLTVNGVVRIAHQFCQPFRLVENTKKLVTLPEQVARLYLDRPNWGVPPLAGICTTPLIRDDGSIQTKRGYDEATQTWVERLPKLQVPERPTRREAEAALLLLRQWFRTFCFRDSTLIPDGGISVVDLGKPPGMDESCALTGLLTAVARASLWLAPGVVVVAPRMSGAGTGKALLLRGISAIAFGLQPSAFSRGSDLQEMDKRLVAAFVDGEPGVLLDNLNETTLRSDTLASALTERPAKMRVLGKSAMLPLNSAAFVMLTGNALTVSEDLTRRLIPVHLDARTEDPEARPFEPGFLEKTTAERPRLLAAALTIIRWGRLFELPRGMSIGSYETWSEWVRDPLVALGCQDAVRAMRAQKEADPRRAEIAEVFRLWWWDHWSRPVRASELSERVRKLLDPQERGRQHVAAKLPGLVGTRMAGFVMTSDVGSAKRSVATYALRWTGDHDKAPPHGAPMEN